MKGDLPDPDDPREKNSPSWLAFKSQFGDYNQQAQRCRLAHQCTRATSLVSGAAVTVCAGIGAWTWVTACLGALIVVLEGLQQLFRWHDNWIEYRQAAEAMRQDAMDFLAAVGSYSGADRLVVLAAARRRIALSENGSWAVRLRADRAAPATEPT